MSCIPTTLTEVALDCGSNVGGLSVIYIAHTLDVDSVTISGGKVTAITMESGKTFKSFKFRKGNANYSTTGTRTDENGTLFYSTALEAKFNKMETAKRTAMTAVANGNTYVIAKDMNSLYWLIGYSTLETYCSSAVNAATGAAMGDANQYTLTLNSDTPDLPYEVDASIITAIVS